MAGIGFELKKMFSQKGLLSIIKAYGYAGIVCTGPMLLGIILLLGIRVLAGMGGAGEHEKELLNCMITYTLMFSLVLTNCFSLVTTRYTADQLYMEKEGRVMPSFRGSVAIMLILGCIGYGAFLYGSGVRTEYKLLCLILCAELIVVWTQINYLTAIKDYKGIIQTFAVALVAAWIIGWLLIHTQMDTITAMLLTIGIAYGIMMLWYYYLLIGYFPKGNETSLHFLRWFDKYPQLPFLGLFLSLGLFGHIVLMWISPAGVRIEGWFYSTPKYDISALIAFLSILITTISFVTSVEVNFYPKYRNYFSLFNDGGSLKDIRQAEKEMKATLVQELTYTFSKQFFATIVFILLGTFLLPNLPLGMDEDMLGIYRVLCVAYAFYAIGNCTMLIQLYFSDNTGALISGTVFMAVSLGTTWALRYLDIRYYGVGFLAGGIAFTVVSLAQLSYYLNRLMYNVLCSQPIVVKERRTIFTILSEKAERRYRKKFPAALITEEEEE